MKPFHKFYRLLILFFILGIFPLSYSQAQLVSKYGVNITEIKFIINALNGGYYALGTGDSDLIISRLDENLNIIWSKQLGGPGIESPLFFRQESNSHLLMGGWVSQQAFYLETDSSINPITSFQLSFYSQFNSACYSDSNELYIFGDDLRLNHPIGRGTMFSLKFNSTGNRSWGKYVKYVQYSRSPVTAFSYSNLILLLSNQPDGSDHWLALDTINSLGNWSSPISWIWTNLDDMGLNKMPSGKFILSVNGSNVSWSNCSVYLSILNGWSIEIEKAFYFQYDSVLGCLNNLKCIGNNDGGVTGAGMMYNHNNLSTICVFRTDSNLNIQWAYTVKDNENTQLRGLTASPDGGFILLIQNSTTSELLKFDSLGNTICPRNLYTEYSLAPISARQQGWQLMTVDSALTQNNVLVVDVMRSDTLADYCDPTNNSFVENKSEIELYPNPSSEKIFINTKENIDGTLLFYDLIGQLFYSSKITGNNIQIDVSSFKPGIYLFLLTNKNKVFRKKFIKK